jgi:hypothetical protein
MNTLLMIITILEVLALVAVLITSLGKISNSLNHIGGAGDSFLAKLRLGLRAIETETSHLPREVIRLNEGLAKTGEGLKAVEDSIAQSVESSQKQEKYKSS